MPRKRKQNTPDLEQAMQDLETLVKQMESGELSLEESLQAFEEGIKLTRICQKALADAEQKVAILSDKTGNASLEDFETD